MATDTLTEQLRRLLLAVRATGRAILPNASDELLQTIVEAAARLFGAAAASIALVDEQAQELVFRVAHGAGQDEVIGLRIPSNQGIAGYVASTGQPIAVSDVQRDPRFARATAEQTGYVPRSILAMPLIYEDRVIGVMEVLDKISAPSFGMQDMELLSLFARQAAIAIHQAQQVERLNQALLAGLAQLAGDETTDLAGILDSLGDGTDAETREVFEIADSFGAIGAIGEAERQACLQILKTFGEYARSRRRFS